MATSSEAEKQRGSRCISIIKSMTLIVMVPSCIRVHQRIAWLNFIKSPTRRTPQKLGRRMAPSWSATSTFIWTYDTSPPPESSSFNDFVSSNAGMGAVAGFAVLVIILVVGVTVMMKRRNSVSKETLNALSHNQKSRRPSHALETYDEENAISNESTNIPDVQQLHDL